MGLFGNFSKHGGEGVFPIPKTQNQKKSALKSPKKQTKFFTKSPGKFHFERGVPKMGAGWGGFRRLGKISK